MSIEYNYLYLKTETNKNNLIMTTFELTQNYHLEGIEFYNAMDQVRQAFTKYQIKAYFDENSTGVIIVVEDDSDEKVEQIMRDNNIRWRV